MPDILTAMPTVTARDGQIIHGRMPEPAGSGIRLTDLTLSILPSVQVCSSLILLISGLPWDSDQDGAAAGMIHGILSTDRMHTAGEVILITDITGFTLRGATTPTTRPGVMTITAGAGSAILITDTRPFT